MNAKLANAQAKARRDELMGEYLGVISKVMAPARRARLSPQEKMAFRVKDPSFATLSPKLQAEIKAIQRKGPSLERRLALQKEYRELQERAELARAETSETDGEEIEL